MKFMNRKQLFVCLFMVLCCGVLADQMTDCFQQIESRGSGDYRAQGIYGHLGRYQVGVSRMVDLGYCTPVVGGKVISSYDTWNRNRNTAAGLDAATNHWEDCQWTQKAKDMGVDSKEDFLNNTGGIQDKMIVDQMAKIDQEYDRGNFQQYVGKVDPATGVAMTEETIKYMIHNGGAGNADKYLDNHINGDGKLVNTEMKNNIGKMNDCMGGATPGAPAQDICV